MHFHASVLAALFVSALAQNVTRTPNNATTVQMPTPPAGPSCGTPNQWTIVKSNDELARLKDCVRFQGSLRITSLADLAPLSSVQYVEQSLEIVNAPLTTLNGFKALRTVGDKIYVHENPQLKSLAGLESLSWVGSGLFVYDNPALTSITALSSLTTVNPSLRFPFGIHVYRCSVLDSLRGLGSLRQAGNQLEISRLPKLTSLDGLPTTGPLEIANITITENAMLNNITAARVLQSRRAPVTLNVTANAALTSLDGLEGLTQINTLTVNNNPRLSSVRALGNVTRWTGQAQLRHDWSLCDTTGINNVSATVDKCDPSRVEGAVKELTASTASHALGGPTLSISCVLAAVSLALLL